MLTLVERLQVSLKAKGMSRRRLAQLAEVHPNTLNGWFSGKTENPQTGQMKAVARVLGVNYEWLAAGMGDQTPAGAAENVIPYTAPPPALDLALMESSMLAVLQLLHQRRLKLSPERTVAGIMAVYEAAKGQGRSEITEADVTPLVRLFVG